MTKTHKKLRKSLEKGAKITQDVMAISYIDYVCCYEKLNFDVQGQHKTYSSRLKQIEANLQTEFENRIKF